MGINRTSVYVPDDIIEELRIEAARTQRSVSWLVRAAWLVARDTLRKLPAVPR